MIKPLGKEESVSVCETERDFWNGALLGRMEKNTSIGIQANLLLACCHIRSLHKDKLFPLALENSGI